MEQRLHWLFAALAFVFGVQYAMVLPPLQAPDEHTHFFRAYDMSNGHLVAVTDLALPDQLRQLAKLFPPRVEMSRRITPAELIALGSTPTSEQPKVFIGYTPLSLYPFLPYLPAATAIRVARWFHAPTLDLVYLGRLANLAVYITFACSAVFLIPDFKLLLCGLALMPMTLHQAASFSADSVTIAMAFLFCAYVLRLAYGDRPISRPQQWTLAAIVAAVCLCKFIVYLLVLMFLIPKTKFRNAWAWARVIALQFGVAGLVIVVWQFFNRQNVARFEADLSAMGIAPSVNLHYVYREPILFAAALARTMQFDGYRLMREFVGVLGWLNVPLPAWMAILYMCLLAGTAMFAGGRTVLLTKRSRMVLGLAGAAGFSATFLSAFVGLTKTFLDTEISRGQGAVPGLQGRYFIPLALPLFLAVSSRRFRVHACVAIPAVLGFAAIMNGVALNRVVTTYYAHSSAQPANARAARATLIHQGFPAPNFEGNLVQVTGPYLPQDRTVYVISDGTRHAVTDPGWIASHGYNWPGDVIVIPRAQLEAIPLGDAAGAPSYEGQLVRRPGSTPEDEKVYIVKDGMKHWVMDKRWIIENGLRWPEDVKTIPGHELDAIPTGAVIAYNPMR
jgi:uncharacterized membrane protein